MHDGLCSFFPFLESSGMMNLAVWFLLFLPRSPNCFADYRSVALGALLLIFMCTLICGSSCLTSSQWIIHNRCWIGRCHQMEGDVHAVSAGIRAVMLCDLFIYFSAYLFISNNNKVFIKTTRLDITDQCDWFIHVCSTCLKPNKWEQAEKIKAIVA